MSETRIRIIRIAVGLVIGAVVLTLWSPLLPWRKPTVILRGISWAPEKDPSLAALWLEEDPPQLAWADNLEQIKSLTEQGYPTFFFPRVKGENGPGVVYLVQVGKELLAHEEIYSVASNLRASHVEIKRDTLVLNTEREGGLVLPALITAGMLGYVAYDHVLNGHKKWKAKTSKASKGLSGS